MFLFYGGNNQKSTTTTSCPPGPHHQFPSLTDVVCCCPLAFVSFISLCDVSPFPSPWTRNQNLLWLVGPHHVMAAFTWPTTDQSSTTRHLPYLFECVSPPWQVQWSVGEWKFGEISILPPSSVMTMTVVLGPRPSGLKTCNEIMYWVNVSSPWSVWLCWSKWTVAQISTEFLNGLITTGLNLTSMLGSLRKISWTESDPASRCL